MIPKIIHYFWVGNKPIPEKALHCIESWKKFCPEYRIMLWNDTNYDVSACRYMEQAYNRKYWGFVPDYARLDIIFEYGGIYLDTDVELIKNLDPLLTRKAFFGFETSSYVAPGLGFGAEPHHPFIGEHRDFYHKISFIKPDGSPNLTPSPQYTTKLLSARGLRTDNTLQTVAGVTVYPEDFFAPLNCVTGFMHKTVNTYSIHWYDASWFTKKQHLLKTIKWKIYRIFGLKTGKWLVQVLYAFILLCTGNFVVFAEKIREKTKKRNDRT